MIFDKPVDILKSFIFRKKQIRKIESLELNRDSLEMKRNKNDRYDIMTNSKYEEIFDF